MSIPIIYFIICGVIGLILWFIMIKILESKGYSVNYFLTSLSDYSKFLDMIKNEPDISMKRKYKCIFWWQVAMIPICFIGTFILIEYFR
jgi:hypothetical protein